MEAPKPFCSHGCTLTSVESFLMRFPTSILQRVADSIIQKMRPS
jgi:hypothetical protein